MQAVPAGQATPHAPQSSLLFIRLTHAPAHRVFGPEQPGAHEPPSQTRPGEQAFPQAPQLEGSSWMSMHAPAHRAVPDGHTQALPTQRNPGAHCRAQPPQFDGSVEVSTHPPPQRVVPDAQPIEVQAPAWHTSPAAHA
jgi:hypothetical protein